MAFPIIPVALYAGATVFAIYKSRSNKKKLEIVKEWRQKLRVVAKHYASVGDSVNFRIALQNQLLAYDHVFKGKEFEPFVQKLN